MEVVFCVSVAFVAYAYVGYPALLGVWAHAAVRLGLTPPVLRERRARAAERRRAERGADRRSYCGVSVIVAARDEGARLPARISNLLESDYPATRLQIIVASDGSSDGTPDALARFGDAVDLITLPPSGKALALNAAVGRARHAILVFADARQRFAPDAIRRLVSNFRDPSVGAVSGELVLDAEAGAEADASATGFSSQGPSTVGEGVGLYWTYEKWLRRREAIVGSTLGVTGAIYAMRRDLWQPLPADTVLDDVLGPMRVVLRGHRVTFDGTARAFDDVPKDLASELGRKVRTLAGNLQLLAREPRLLVPFVNPVWLQFVSHKLARLLVPYFLMTLLASSAALAPQSWLYAGAFLAQAGFYGLAVYGAAIERRGRAEAPRRAKVFNEAA